MAIQGRTDQKNFPFFLSGSTLAREGETILQNGARATVLACYTLMAKVRAAVPANGNGTADAGNVGNGALSGIDLIVGTLPRAGTYSVNCIAAEAHGGTFQLLDPSGNVVRRNLVMTPGAGLGTTFLIPEIGVKFTLTDGAVDFAEGDQFTFAITFVNKWTPFNPALVNGAQIPAGIFVGDNIAAATIVAGDVAGQPIIVAGVGATFDASQLVIENNATLDTVLLGGLTVREHLYKLGMFAEDTIDVNVLEN